MSETSLQQVSGWSAEHLERLKTSWITTAEQVVAVAATDGGVRSLSEQLKLSEADTERLVALARAALAPTTLAAMDQPFSSDERGMGAMGPERRKDNAEGVPGGPARASIDAARRLPFTFHALHDERKASLVKENDMSTATRNDVNEATGFSSFGGHLIASTDAGRFSASLGTNRSGVVSTLNSLGMEDAEQVVAVAAIPEARTELQQVLGLQDKDFQAFLSQLQGLLPAAEAAALGTPSPRNLGFGARAPTAEMMAALEASASEDAGLDDDAVSLPASMNLIAFFQPIRSQGPRGTCVAFTVTALNEYIKRRRGILRDLSEQDAYYGTKLIDGSPGGCGTWQSKAVTVLAGKGQCRELVWPYLSALPCNNHGPRPAAATADALLYRLATLAVPPRNVLAYKMHMAKQRPVTLSFPVYNSWYSSAATRQTGRITMRIGNEASIGGHAVCLVGYVDTPSSPGGGYFIVRNSWGTSAFGSACPFGAGYGTIPYQYVANDAWEAYTAVVPGINSPEDQDEQDGHAVDTRTGPSTVTIDVGPSVKITIATK